MIVDPRNELCAETSGPPQPFQLGHLDQLAALLEVAALAGQEVSFTKLDKKGSTANFGSGYLNLIPGIWYLVLRESHISREEMFCWLFW